MSSSAAPSGAVRTVPAGPGSVLGRSRLGLLAALALVISLIGLAGPANSAGSAASTGSATDRAAATDPSLGTVGGWVGVNTTAIGTPAPRGGVTVSFFAQDSAGSWVAKASTRTNLGGNYTIALAPGSYRVHYADKDPVVESAWYDGPATGGFVDHGTTDPEQATVLRVVAGQAITKVSAGLKDSTTLIPGRGTITGLVHRAGAPPTAYQDVLVTAYLKTSTGAWRYAATAYTDGVGRYSLELAAGRYQIYFHDDVDEFAVPAWYAGPETGGGAGTTGAQSDATVLALNGGQRFEGVSAVIDHGTTADPRFGTIEGTVVGDRAPAGPGFVDFYRTDGDRPVLTVPLATAGTDPGAEPGSWQARLASGVYQMRFRGSEFKTEWWQDRPERYGVATVGVFTDRVNHVQTTVTSIPQLQVSGRVTMPDGSAPPKPVSGLIQFRAEYAGLTTWIVPSRITTQPDGSYSFKVFPNQDYFIRFDEGYFEGRNRYTWYEAGSSLADATPLKVGTESLSGVDMVLSPPGMLGQLSGTITMPEGSDRGWVRLVAVGADPISFTASVGAGGAYRLENLPTGDYRMIVTTMNAAGNTASSYYGTYPYTADTASIVQVKRGENVDIDFAPPPRARLDLYPGAGDWQYYMAQLWRLDDNGSYVRQGRAEYAEWPRQEPRWLDLLYGSYKLQFIKDGTSYWYDGEDQPWVNTVDQALPIDIQGDTQLTVHSPTG